jgi:hypothetical protein
MRRGIFCFWTGDNEMSDIRKRCLISLQRSGLPVYLVNKEVIENYQIVPYHEAYHYLSDVHKSDYLRCYFMHHFGGGYSDIKSCNKSWLSAFVRMEKSDALALGYQEVGAWGVAECESEKERQVLCDNYKKLIGVCSMICKPKTDFTTEWMEKVNSKLDYKLQELKRAKGNVMGNNEGYPLRWTELLGDIFHPLVYKYSDRILQDNINPDFKKQYR